MPLDDGKGLQDDRYDLILVGTGFASSFFLQRYLQRAGKSVHVLVLERGQIREHNWQLTHRRVLEDEADASFIHRESIKPWAFRLAFGGCSNCWWASTPRFLPEDFRLRSLYGVAADWPIDYDELENYYCEAEGLMAVSGSADGTPFPMSRPYPLPPHRLTDPDRLLKRHFPGQFFNLPTARPSRALPSGRPKCCATGTCGLCPINSKFTILNELRNLYEDDPRVTLRVGANVVSVDVANNVATGVRYIVGDREQIARADVVGLGANALFNPYILLRSGLTDTELGRGLMEQVSVMVEVLFDGIDNFQGSTSLTGHGYMVYGGSHRAEHAGALIETSNVPALRDERGKWRQRGSLRFIYEDIREPENRVVLNRDDASKPEVVYRGHSEYSNKGIASLESSLPPILEALPVERFWVQPLENGTEAHILGTTVMGRDPATSVVDRDHVHHRVRNLLVLGGSVFPTTAPANPTLTISALSLRAADRLIGRASRP